MMRWTAPTSGPEPVSNTIWICVRYGFILIANGLPWEHDTNGR